MFPALILTLTVGSIPVVPRLEITPTLSIDAQYMEPGQRVPYEGMLIRLEDVAHLKTEIMQADASCQLRLTSLETSLKNQIVEMQTNFEQRVVGYVERIDVLGNDVLREQQAHEQTRKEYRHFKWATYGVGAALVTSAGFMFWVMAN